MTEWDIRIWLTSYCRYSRTFISTSSLDPWFQPHPWTWSQMWNLSLVLTFALTPIFSLLSYIFSFSFILTPPETYSFPELHPRIGKSSCQEYGQFRDRVTGTFYSIKQNNILKTIVPVLSFIWTMKVKMSLLLNDQVSKCHTPSVDILPDQWFGLGSWVINVP